MLPLKRPLAKAFGVEALQRLLANAFGVKAVSQVHPNGATEPAKSLNPSFPFSFFAADTAAATTVVMI